MNDDLKQKVYEALADVFGIMFYIPIEPLEDESAEHGDLGEPGLQGGLEGIGGGVHEHALGETVGEHGAGDEGDGATHGVADDDGALHVEGLADAVEERGEASE